ncbi:hypothetical protein KC19_7G059400 [Ceratodon purpureus]|uniref:DNA-directed RNA polymerase subunit n=2 Tax=Ceratodon purpureus TaxID=3225 RepID=A0A8T0H826_CERPU|nr:hypothetical protein KC19_7G059400 [Ceratodon purpureus]
MDDRDGEVPLAELTGIQFGVLNQSDIMTYSVFERDHSITGPKDLWDGRLGVYNLPGVKNHCLTCGARKASDCEGHFGHIVLPREVYHPLHIRFLKTVLNRICLVCYRLKEKKEFKRGTQQERTTWMEIKRQLNNGGSPDRKSDTEIVDGERSCGLKTRFDEMSNEEFFAMSTEEVEELAELVEGLGVSETSDNGPSCKYCGANIISSEVRYPNLEVALSRNVDSAYETIEMRACVKEEKVPRDYWSFVQGNPGSRKNIRPLFPCEALSILRNLPEKVISELGMDALVAPPEALILSRLPLPPSGSRIAELDIGSRMPLAHKDKQQMHLQRLASEVHKVQTQSIGKPTFSSYQREVKELQVVSSNYLTGSKWENGLKYKAYNPVKKDVEKDDKLMKSILGKTNNSCARLIVVGDPSIKIEEILLPVFLVEALTVPEKVTTFNRNRLQQYVDNGPYAHLYRTGAVYVDQRGVKGNLDLKRPRQGSKTVQIGDIVHRHIKDGDLVIVNRPPSLTKHSIMAMQVRLHLGCSSAINPLICPSFQADFDGDTMHIYVPQSPESLAELQSFMRVSDQLINPQGGQSNNVLAEDSRLGAYLITNSGLFLNKAEICQLISSILPSLPIPAILKAPKVNEPLWTGQQLYSTVLPKGICYRARDRKFSSDVKRGVLIQDGELLVCDGNSQWLGSAPDALTAVISKVQGPAAALAYLNQAQELANMYIRDRGFSVGLQDFQLTRDRSHLLRMRLEHVIRGNGEALMQTLLEDQNVQREELKKDLTDQRGLSAGMECRKSKGLFLGSTGTVKRSEALSKVAIERFQKKFGQNTDDLVKAYCTSSNPLSVMIKAGSKGSTSKLVSQTISLGLQLYKGENLLPWSAQDLSFQRELFDTSSSRVSDLLQFDIGAPLLKFSGYWESRGIITSSYLDGLSPLQFFTHNIAARYGMLRAKVEEPCMLLKRLLLFLRNLHVGYDGTVRSSEGQHIVQFEYGGLLEMDGHDSANRPIGICEAGEAVGILAATAITEPAYQMKLDSPHNVGAKAIGPLDLIKESLSSKKALSFVDRRVLLRIPLILRQRQQEKTALKIATHLKPVTLDMVTSTTMIEYRPVTDEGKVEAEDGNPGRNSHWVGHVRLNVEKLKVHQVSVTELLTRLKNRHSTTCSFSSSNRCRFESPPASRDEPELCIHFFSNFAKDFWSKDSLSDEEHGDHSSTLLEVTKFTLLPILMCTIVKGDERIQSVTLLWEDMDWNPKCAKIPLKDSCKHESGEVVVEVAVKDTCCKVRGKAWEIVKEACLPIMQLLDWQRCTPYSIKELNHVFGLEAAKGVLLQRLELAAAGMGKAVNLEHLELIADSMLISGEVNGATLSGYKDLCKAISRSTPFSDAAHMNPKNSFVSAARHGASETIEGALSSSVWGKAPSLGTGSNFGVLWQAKVEEKPGLEIQQGVDIHDCIMEINSSVPTGSCDADSVLHRYNRPHRRPTRQRFKHRIRPHEAPSKAPFRGRNSATNGQGAVHPDKAISHAGLDRASDDGSNSHPPMTVTISTEKLTVSTEKLTLVTSRTERPEDSSSFHTPNETLETHSALSDSPCSSFRKNLHSPNFVEYNASEGDQMSGISQPPLETLDPIDVVGAESFVTTHRAKKVEHRVLQGLEGSGSISPIEERLSREVLERRSNCTTDTSSRLNASEDAFHLTPELNDEWKRLERLHREAHAILFRKYEVRQKLKETDQVMIMKNVLQFHPDYVQKAGCGVDHIKVDYHQRHSTSRCFFVVRNDGSACDFSYLKCIKSFANTKSPVLAMKYDYHYFMRDERDKRSYDVDQLDPFGYDNPSDLVPPWSPLPEHDQHRSDPTLPTMMRPNDGFDCDESKFEVVCSKTKEESSCETSELTP